MIKKLLIVDDDLPFRERLSRSLEKKGFNVQSSPSFNESIKMVNESSFDFAVVDMRLEDGSGLELVKQIQKISPQTKIIFIANPNNPTGTYVNETDMITLLDATSPSTMVVLDEAYAEYVDASDYPNGLALIKKYPNLMITRTFSKIYGLANLRIGYGIAQAKVVQQIQKVRQPFNVNNLAIRAAEIALQTPDFLNQSIELNKRGKVYLYDALEKMALGICKSEANFICVFLPISGDEAAKRLLEKGIIVRSLASFGLRNAIRVTIDTEKNNQRFIQTLEESL